MVQLPALHLQDRETVFIEFSNPLQLDDADDPVYPWVPPSLPETISTLRRTTNCGTVKHLVLSLPYASRDADSQQALLELATFLTGPPCSELRSVKIMGSTYVLNDTFFLAACAKLRTVDTLEVLLNGQADSYSLAAILCAFAGVAKLHLALPATDFDVHKSFKEETWQTFENLQSFTFDINGAKADTIPALLRAGSLRGLGTLDVVFMQRWGVEAAVALLSAIGGPNQLGNFSLTKRSSDARSKRGSEMEGLDLLLQRLPGVNTISISSETSSEPLLLPTGFMDSLPQKMIGIRLKNAYITSPQHVLQAFAHRLCFFPLLRHVSLDLFVSEETQDPDTSGEVRGGCVGHPTSARIASWPTLSMLANDLEAASIGHNLILRSETKREERSYVARSE
jgi:hypothetical protein